jgi:hypothetical protein
MKKVSSRSLLNSRPFSALRDNRAEAEEEALKIKKHEQERALIRVKREDKIAFARVLSTGSYRSLYWLFARWHLVSRRVRERTR